MIKNNNDRLSLFIAIATLFFTTTCAYLPQSSSTDQTPFYSAPKPQPPVVMTSNNLATDIPMTAEKNQMDEPIFTRWSVLLDPSLWPDVHETLSTLNSGQPTIVGQLPGQRLLPTSHFEEAAIAHNPVAQGTVIYQPLPSDLWARIRQGFQLDHQHPNIQTNLNWYISHPAHLVQVTKRAKRYLYYILEAIESRNIPTEIALLPMIESAFQPFAYSPKHAAGIWQFIPSTGKLYGLKQTWWYDGRRDIIQSTQAALKLLTQLHAHFDHDWLLALAAYNAGQGAVSRAIRKNTRQQRPTDFWSLDLPSETRRYIPKLLALSSIIANPHPFNLTLQPIANRPYLKQVTVNSQIDLALAATLADISLEELYLLNPGFNRWATPPDGPHDLVIPWEKANHFIDHLANLPKQNRVIWIRHQITKNESLFALALRYQTSVQYIKKINRLSNNTIITGQSLLIPFSLATQHNPYLSAKHHARLQSLPSYLSYKKMVYQVQPGDNLWQISNKFNISYQALAQWNNMPSTAILKANKKLTLWLPQQQMTPSSTTHPPIDNTSYRVQNGDSLTKISQKFQVSINDLLRWNNINNKDYLQSGQHLTVQTHH